MLIGKLQSWKVTMLRAEKVQQNATERSTDNATKMEVPGRWMHAIKLASILLYTRF